MVSRAVHHLPLPTLPAKPRLQLLGFPWSCALLFTVERKAFPSTCSSLC